MSLHFKKSTLGLSVLLIVSLVLGMWVSSGIAQAKYPTRPVTIIIPFGPGGSTDIAVRRLQPFLSKALGVTVIAQNKKGAGGRIGATEAFRAKPDGYTLVAHNMPTIVMGELLFNPPYSAKKMVPIGAWISTPKIVVVHKDSPYKTFQNLVSAAKQKELKLAIVGFGTTDHLVSILLKENAGLRHRAIPFGSGGKAVQAVLGKHTEIGTPNTVSGKPHFDAGRVRVLAVCSAEPAAGFEGIPTFKQLGYNPEGLSVETGLMGPPGMDENIAEILAKALQKAVKDPKYLEMAKKADEPLKIRSREQWKAQIDETFSTVRSYLSDLKADMAKKKK